jgi:serine/threonine protein kinase
LGEVFKVENEMKKIMVMKIIQLGKEGTEEFNKNVKSMEAEIGVGIKLGRLSKFLVKITDFFFKDEYCYFVMEFCSGGDLERIFNKKNRIPQKVLFFIYLI